MPKISATDDYLIDQGKIRMIDVYRGWFNSHPDAIANGIAEDDLYEAMQNTIGKNTSRLILWDAGFYVNKIQHHPTRKYYRIVLSKDYRKTQPWYKVWDNRYQPCK